MNFKPKYKQILTTLTIFNDIILKNTLQLIEILFLVTIYYWYQVPLKGSIGKNILIMWLIELNDINLIVQKLVNFAYIWVYREY